MEIFPFVSVAVFANLLIFQRIRHPIAYSYSAISKHVKETETCVHIFSTTNL